MMLELPHMFETKFQTYWADVDSAGANHHALIRQHHVWMPRVEAFSKFSKPIRHEFEIVDDPTSEKLADGDVMVVCVDHQFKSTPIPDAIRTIVEKC